MLALLGYATIAIVLILIMTKKASTIVALIAPPVVAALIAGSGWAVTNYIVGGVKTIAPTAVMFIFAVLYFGLMSDSGMFDPVINGILKRVGRDPLKITVAAAALAMLVHLDGSGVVTFSVTIPAMLPLFNELKMDKRILACVVGLGAGIMNMVPWGGPTLRAASALNVPITDLYNPMVIPEIAGIIAVLAIAWYLGLKERKRLGVAAGAGAGVTAERTLTDEEKVLRRPKLVIFNLILTLVSLGIMIAGKLSPTATFMLSFAIAITVNYPNPKDQTKRINAHAQGALMMAAVLFAAGVLTGVLQESGMLPAMAEAAAGIVPAALGGRLPLIVGILAVPLSPIFDPNSFYYGILPVLSATASSFGVDPVFMARAAIAGQNTVGFPIDPLTASTWLLLGLTGVELGDHQKFSFKWFWLVSLVILAVSILIGVIPF